MKQQRRTDRKRPNCEKPRLRVENNLDLRDRRVVSKITCSRVLSELYLVSITLVIDREVCILGIACLALKDCRVHSEHTRP